MAVFEMPLDQLRTYRGRNPRPEGFDAFWEAALAEADALDPEPTLEPAAFEGVIADCHHLWFTGVGGARVHARLWQPKEVHRPHPALLRFHGYGRRAPDWSAMLGWAARGYTVAALDCRGQGGSSEDPGGVRGNTQEGHIVRGLDDAPERLLYRQIFLDTAVLARLVMAREDVDPTRVGATGASQGGGLTLACAALVPELKLAAPIYPFLSDYQRVWEMDLARAAYEELQTYFRLFDPRHEREEEVFTRLGYIDVHHLAPRIQAETMLVTGLADQVCPPSTQFAAYNAIRSPKRQVLYPDFGHETLPEVDDLVWSFMGGL